MTAAAIAEYLGWALFTIIKFVFTPSIMIAQGYHWIETLLTVGIGACLGFVAFYFFGELIFKSIARWRKKPARKFTRMNRLIVTLRQRYGMLGFGLISGLISVPVAGLLCARFFPDPKKAIPGMLIAFSVWTAVLTALSYLVRHQFA